ncbi:MAG: hypothetical protein KJN60_05875 [Boseongicola sp.]|nr:hypothetical protein [Boseongicola sp.]
MFFRDLKMKPTTIDVTFVEARLPVHMGHRDASTVFGEPLNRQLAATAMGTLTKVRAHEAGPDDICGVTLYLGLRDASRESLERVGRMLDFLHAPYGSSIRRADGGEPVMFGVAEGLEISVDSALAPDGAGRRDFAKMCSEAMKGLAINRGWTRRADKTVFYFYGESVRSMQDRLTDALEANPILASARARRLA